MGDTFGDGHSNEKPVHSVTVSDFYMGKYPITQGQWINCMGYNPSYVENCGDSCPVDGVSWYDAHKFIEKLNNSSNGKFYRLPTEAEWEYAARSGGKNEKYAGTSSYSDVGDYAWCSLNSDDKIHPVGQKKPNSLGLYDMSGNINEWCEDWYEEGYHSIDQYNNPQGPSSGELRVVRGGGYISNGFEVCASNRSGCYPAFRMKIVGFRGLPIPHSVCLCILICAF